MAAAKIMKKETEKNMSLKFRGSKVIVCLSNQLCLFTDVSLSMTLVVLNFVRDLMPHFRRGSIQTYRIYC